MKAVPFAPLDPAVYRDLVRQALAEDIGAGDITTDATVDSRQQAHAVLLVEAQDQLELVDVLDDRDDVAPQLCGQHDRLDITVVLESVADNDAVRVFGHGHDHQ